MSEKIAEIRKKRVAQFQEAMKREASKFETLFAEKILPVIEDATADYGETFHLGGIIPVDGYDTGILLFKEEGVLYCTLWDVDDSPSAEEVEEGDILVILISEEGLRAVYLPPSLDEEDFEEFFKLLGGWFVGEDFSLTPVEEAADEEE